jgi:hypothetical protein
MAYRSLEDITGVGKVITLREKYKRLSFEAGTVVDEVSVIDGEQKYVIQFIRLAENVACDGDPTRHVFRIGYYTQRTDGWFCLGSQYAPIVTPSELRLLLDAVTTKGWLKAQSIS